MTTTPFVRSITDRLKRLARERDTNYAHVLTEFLIERAVSRLTAEPTLRAHLVFKGGFVGLRVYGSPRYTVDLDAVVFENNAGDIVALAKAAMASDLSDHVWFSFQEATELVTQGDYGGTRLQYRAGLGAVLLDLRRAQIINIDIGTGDPVTPAPRLETTPSTLGDGAMISWLVYPVETIIAEKLHPLVRRGGDNSRAKDIFDLAFYLPNADPKLLRSALERTFSFRNDRVPGDFAAYLDGLDRSVLRRGWPAAMKTMTKVPDFDETFAAVVSGLRRYGL